MSKVYQFKDYDKYFCLKPNLDMWMVILFLLRPYVMLVSTLRMGPGGRDVKGASFIKELVYPDYPSMMLGVIASIPALLFIFAFIKRKPGAPDFFRKVWHKSALLLVMSSALSIVVIILPLVTGVIYRINVIGWVQVAISIVIIPYLLFSKRVKDTFLDYPDDILEDRRRGVAVSGK